MQRVQAAGGVVAIQSQIQGKVVTGAGRDDQQRNAVLGGDAGDERLGPIPAGHPQQVGPIGHRPAGQLAHIPLPERGFMIRNGRLGGATSYSCIRSGMASRRNAARPAATASANNPSHQHHPGQSVAGVQDQHRQRGHHRQCDRQAPDQAPVGQRPPHPGHGQRQADQPDQHQGQALPEPGHHRRHQHGRRGGHQGQAGQPALGDGRTPGRLAAPWSPSPDHRPFSAACRPCP